MIPISTGARRAGQLARFAFVLLAAACNREDAATEGAAPVVHATIARVVTQPFRETVSAIGTVVPRPAAVALLSAPAATRVANVFVVAGQPVRKGEPLVEFERAPFDARAASADTALQSAERAYARAHRLVEIGIAARKDEEQAASDLARARADAVAARREAQLARLESPIDGVVTKLTAVLGASVDASQPVVEIADPRAVDIVVTVTPDEAARIRRGARVAVTSSAATGAERLGTSEVTDVGGTVDPDTRGVAVRIRGVAATRPLRIGESVVADIVVAEYAAAVVVPVTALVPDGEGFKVFVVDEAGVAHEQPVNVGGRTTTEARVTGGVAAGQLIVTEGAFGMTDGAKVASGAARDNAPASGAGNANAPGASRGGKNAEPVRKP